MSITKQMEKEIKNSTGNALPLEIGNQVMHTVSKIRGQVVEVAKVGSETVVTIRTTTGRLLTKLNRREFVLDSRVAAYHRDEAILDAKYEEPGAKLEGPVSDGSILDEIC
jgi:hypothetical protein